jgi:iron complex outermembrane receptor protein
MPTSSKAHLLWLSVLLLLAWQVAIPREAVAADQPDQTDQALKNLSLSELGNIEVTTVSKEPVVVWKTPAAIFVITQLDIQRSGATSIPEALRLAPGVEVARISSDEWSIGIRGFGSRLSRSVLVLMDGRIVYSPFTAGVYWEVQDYLMEDIDRIEVIRGPGGTIWGPNAVNGVINIITKSSKDTQGGLVSGGAGNVEQGFGEARYGGTRGPDFSYRIYGKGFARAPEFHADGDNYDSWQAGQAGFRMDWTKALATHSPCLAMATTRERDRV